MDTGEHVVTLENEKIYDTVKRQWAAVSTTVKRKNEKIWEAAYGEGQGSGATKGWALKKQKAAVRILPRVFNEGTRQDKAKQAVIAEEIKRKFSREEWLETQTIKLVYSGNTLNVLDLTLHLQDGFIITDIYTKPTDSHLYLHFCSSHPAH